MIVPDYKEYWRFRKEMPGNWGLESNVEKRDALFYYLLVANIVLLIIMGVLVFGSIRSVYLG